LKTQAVPGFLVVRFGFNCSWQGNCLQTGSQIHVAPGRNDEYALDIKGIGGSLAGPAL
jgi:hypothetical protein